MFGTTFYFRTIRKMVSLFGTVFNDIHVARVATDGTDDQLIKVPLTYAPKEKMLARVEQDPSITRPSAINLPAMSFEMVGYEYDNARKLNTVAYRSKKHATDPNLLKKQFMCVPYNIYFNLYVYVKNAEDGTRIIEQILPYFTPEWTASVDLIPEMDVTHDIPIILNSVQSQDSYGDGDFTKKRAIIWTLSFTVKTYFYGPVKNKPIIKFANTSAYVSTDAAAPSSRVTVKPGLTANGTPTSNASISISRDLIEIDDDYGFIVDQDNILLP